MPLLIFLHSDDFVFFLSGEPWYGPRLWESRASIRGQRWKWETHGGRLGNFLGCCRLGCTFYFSRNLIRNILNHLVVLCWMQIIELPSHKFFIGAQFHPEFKSRPGKPSPLFLGNMTILCKNTTSFFLSFFPDIHFANKTATHFELA